MDTTSCRVIYVNRSIDQDCLVRGNAESFTLSSSNAEDWKNNALLQGLQPLVESFGDGKYETFLSNAEPFLLLPFALAWLHAVATQTIADLTIFSTQQYMFALQDLLAYPKSSKTKTNSSAKSLPLSF